MSQHAASQKFSSMPQTSDQERFSGLFLESERALCGFVFSLLPNRADADDVLQETLRCLWEHHHEYDHSRPFLPWACQFAYMQVLQMRRRHAIRGKYFCDALVETLADERPVDSEWEQSQKKALMLCLKTLSNEDRELVELRYDSDKSITDLSTQLGQTANTFYKRLQRIRQELVECITRRVGIEGGRQ